jgi:predicted permease
MFSVVNSILLRPLPGYQTDRLVNICDAGRGGCNFLDPGIYLRLRDRLRSFSTLTANQNCRMNLTGGGDAEQLTGPCATSNWFELQHAQAMLGRTFLPDEDRHGRNHVVVLDHAFWQRKFGGDPKVVGSKLVLDKEPWLVIGVMPAGYRPIAGAPALIYTPYVVEDNPHGLNVNARLKPDMSLEAARAELRVAATHLASENPDWKTLTLEATPLLEQATGPQRPLLLLLLGAVSLVLLIACLNVANLVLARSAARQHEIDIRIALGASRGRIVRFLIAESLLVCSAASAGAVAVAYGGLRALRPLTARLPRADELAVDGRVLVCALLLGLMAALCFGLLPVLRPFRRARISRPQTSLIAAEVALSFVLLIGAGLLIRTFIAIRSTDLGYDPRNVLTHFLALLPSADGSRDAGVMLYERIRERVSALPGVRGVATASSLPMFGVSISMDVHPEGQPEQRHEHIASLTVVSEDYFRVMAIPVREGRAFTSHDRPGSTRVIVVSQSIANRYFGGKAIGKRVLIPEFQFNVDGREDLPNEIVGVAGNVCQNSVEDCEAEHIYLPERQNALRMANLAIRTAGPPFAIVNAVHRAITLEAPDVPLDEPTTLEQRTGYLSDDPKRAMWLLGVFAGLALILAAAGIYGVSSCLAVQQSREIGIRIALGARVADIAALVYRTILAPSAVGLAVGLAASFWLTRLLKSLLFGVRAVDPGTLTWSALTLLAVAVLAATGPAVRAALTDPAKVLRRE